MSIEIRDDKATLQRWFFYVNHVEMMRTRFKPERDVGEQSKRRGKLEQTT